jgi:hypothetical protein
MYRPTFAELAQGVQGEFREMPGLHLTEPPRAGAVLEVQRIPLMPATPHLEAQLQHASSTKFTGPLPAGYLSDTRRSYRGRMRKAKVTIARADELRAMLTAYRHLTVEEAERGNWGDIQVELEGELWRIEQELLDRGSHRVDAA